jgi:pullulanase/glycogen debranching enzyme
MPKNGLQLAKPPATHAIRPGRPHPLGATPDAYGVNFAIFARHATGVELLLFDSYDNAEPTQVIPLDPGSNKSFFFWHVYVEGLCSGAHYAYRIEGPLDLSTGRRFNRNKVLIDPYARGNTRASRNRVGACGPEDNSASMRSVVIEAVYDREGDFPLNRPAPEMVIGENGAAMAYRSVWSIGLSRQLLDTKGIAQARDAGGLYQTDFLPGYRWSERSRRYRDVVRRFVNGEPGLLGAIASRIAGSADIEQAAGHLPLNSINLVARRAGLTLDGLVSYDDKHNCANGECNRDGLNNNLSWTCGLEGPFANADVEALRARQIRNFTAILLLSQGVPMFVAGDDVRRTRQGNSSADRQDNALSWFVWSLVQDNKDLLRFYRRMINFRKRTPALRRPRHFTGAVNMRGLKDMAWSACRLGEPDWHDPEGRALAFTLGGFGDEPDLHVMMNMYREPLAFDLPSGTGPRGSGLPGSKVHWYRVADTAMPAPDDIVELGSEVAISFPQYPVSGRSVVVLSTKS